MSDRIRTTPDVRWRFSGVGITPTFRCLGCDTSRLSTGSKGSGIFKRCASCLAAKAEAKARAAG
jgi:hypothetical protein